MLNGDIEALPLKSMAEWMCAKGVDGTGEKIARENVVRVLKSITAQIVVDGQRILDVYKEAVETKLRAQEELENLV